MFHAIESAFHMRRVHAHNLLFAAALVVSIAPLVAQARVARGAVGR